MEAGPLSNAPPRLITPATSLDELFARWRADADEAARGEIVRRAQPLARRLALRYRGAHEPTEDLVQVANFALIKAIDRFDPTRGIDFFSFAIPTMTGELKRYFRDYGWSVHVPRTAKERALRVHAGRSQLEAQLARSPTAQQLADHLNMTLEDVLEGLEDGGAHHATSFETPRGNDENGDATTLGDTLPDFEAGYDRAELRAAIATVAADFSERERTILFLRFVDDLTQAEIGEQLGISQMAVSRSLAKSTRKLAQEMKGSVDHE